MKLKLPETTTKEPYIEFRFNKNGRLRLSVTSTWWGGKNSGFFSSDGSEGNTCVPQHLKEYIKAFKKRKIKKMEKEIFSLQKKLDKIKNEDKDYDFIL